MDVLAKSAIKRQACCAMTGLKLALYKLMHRPAFWSLSEQEF